MPRGGNTKDKALANGNKVGRPKNEAEANDIKIGKGFASRVLDRIGELKLLEVKADGKPGGAIQNAEDYALDVLRSRDAAAREMFKLLLAYQLGKPVQPTFVQDTREFRPLERGNLPSHFSARNAPGLNKPN